MDQHRIVLEARKVVKTYRDGRQYYPVLRGADLEALKSEMLAVVGPSGSGKTTLLNIVGAMDRPTSGEVLFDGKPISTASESELAHYRRDFLGMVFQDFFLISTLTAGENAELPLLFTPKRLTSEQLRERTLEALSRVEMGEWVDHLPGELSGGQKQRVCIARALVNSPNVILADEPTGNLDTSTGDKIVELLKGLTKTGISIIIVTHDPAVAEAADRRLLLNNGILSPLE